MGKYTRSVSQLKSVTRCGEAYRVSRLQTPRPPYRPAPWTILGLALHEAVVAWESDDRRGSLVDRFASAYDLEVSRAWERQPDPDLWLLPPNTKTVKAAIANYRRRGIEKDAKLYEERCREAEWEIMTLPDGRKALELEFSLDLNGVTVKGAIDRILWYPKLGIAAKEDLKTGGPDDENDVRQLAIYRIAALECYKVNLTHGRYWFTKLDRPGEWVDLTRYDRQYLTEQYHILDRMIEQGLLLPNPGKICKLCDVRPWCREMGWLKPGEPLTREETP